MSEPLAVKPISRVAIPQALKKAEHYRLLGDPEQAESICLDVLAAEPEHQSATVVLVLAMTDQFAKGGATSVALAREYVGRLRDGYQRAYYEGLVWEREARACLARPVASGFAYDKLRTAMDCYERAVAIGRGDDDDEAILRWNSCVRTIERSRLSPRPPEPEIEPPFE